MSRKEASDPLKAAFLYAAAHGSFVRRNDRVEVADTLREFPDAITWRDDMKSTALMLAAANGQKAHVETLLAAGAEVDARDGMGNTALMFAACGDAPAHCEIVQMLLDHGADVNAKGVEGDTALIGAAQEPSNAMISLLIRAGANPDAADEDGETAAQHMQRVRDFYVAENEKIDRSGSDRPHYAVPDIAHALKMLNDASSARKQIAEITEGAETPVAVKKPLSFKPKT